MQTPHTYTRNAMCKKRRLRIQWDNILLYLAAGWSHTCKLELCKHHSLAGMVRTFLADFLIKNWKENVKIPKRAHKLVNYIKTYVKNTKMLPKTKLNTWTMKKP
jgi:hypothetical protein